MGQGTILSYDTLTRSPVPPQRQSAGFLVQVEGQEMGVVQIRKVQQSLAAPSFPIPTR